MLCLLYMICRAPLTTYLYLLTGEKKLPLPDAFFIPCFMYQFICRSCIAGGLCPYTSRISQGGGSQSGPATDRAPAQSRRFRPHQSDFNGSRFILGTNDDGARLPGRVAGRQEASAGEPAKDQSMPVPVYPNIALGPAAMRTMFALAGALRSLAAYRLASYRPEKHYMRGPGPKCREKHARAGGSAAPAVFSPRRPGYWSSARLIKSLTLSRMRSA
jgi:hypothetical protein